MEEGEHYDSDTSIETELEDNGALLADEQEEVNDIQLPSHEDVNVQLASSSPVVSPEQGSVSPNKSSPSMRNKDNLKRDEPRCKSHSDDDDDDDGDGDDGRTCPICMDIWSNTGNHRLASLRCGHFFGHSCIMRWLQIGCAAGQRRCPQCNKKANMKEIRVHYARKLQVLDTAERDRLKEELETVQKEKNRLELELARANLNQQLHQQQLRELQQKLSQMELMKTNSAGHCSQTDTSMMQQTSQRNIHLHRNIEICKEGGCRVLAYNAWLSHLIVSQRSTNNLFSGYGIKKIDTVSFRPIQFVFLHPKAIRDLAFHPQRNDMLLSVSLDRCAKLFNATSNSVVQSYTADNPLWSCCWDADNSNMFFVGTSNGAVLHYDVRFTNGALNRLTCQEDSSPVTSLAAIPICSGRTLSRGGVMVCRLNSCWAYERNDPDYTGSQLPFDGPFVSLCYERNSGHVLISTRPSGRYPHARHILCQLPLTTAGEDSYLICNPIHTFQGSTSQKLLSRPCQVSVPGDTLVAAHQESLRSVALWSMSTGQQILTLPASQPVIDLCPLEVNRTQYLAALSDKVLNIYNVQ